MKTLPWHQRPRGARRILEIGGGHDPYAGVTHAVDKFPTDNSHRGGALVVGEGVEFRKGDLESIPYSAEERFDFIYVSHVLEHVDSVNRAIAEINRVASAGYIETPSPLREQIASQIPYRKGVDIHTQFVWKMQIETAVLHSIAKSDATLGEFCDCEEGRFARLLTEAGRRDVAGVEAMLPGVAKTTRLFFREPIRSVVHASFREACAAGACGYVSAREVRRWASWPHRWTAARFRRLNVFLSSLR